MQYKTVFESDSCRMFDGRLFRAVEPARLSSCRLVRSMNNKEHHGLQSVERHIVTDEMGTHSSYKVLPPIYSSLCMGQ